MNYRLSCIQKAFTLIELMVTILVLGLFIMVAVPSMKSFFLNQRMKATRDALVNALNYARSTALTQSVSVVVCPFGVAGSSTCGNNWNQGFVVVTQSGSNTLIQAQQLPANSPSISTAAASITFSARGFSSVSAQFTLCDTRGASAAGSVEVMLSGYVQSSPTLGQAAWGGGLSCP